MKRILSFVIALVLVIAFSACSAEFTDHFTTYTATFTMLIPNPRLNATDNLSSDLDACMSLRITRVCAELIENDVVLEPVIEKTGVTLTTSQLREMLSFEFIKDTDMLTVSVTSDERQQAIDIAQAIADVAPEIIYEIINGVDVQIIDAPTVTENFSIGKLFR